MRPMLSAIVVALVLVTATFLLVVPIADRTLAAPASTSSGLRTAVTPSYHIDLYIGTVPVLAGYHDTLWYDVENDTTGVPITTLSTITILGTYYNTNHKLLPLPGTPINVSVKDPINTWTFQVPVNSSSTLGFWPEITVWANSTSLSMKQTNSVDVPVGNLVIYSDSVCDVVHGCGPITTGNPATVSVNVEAEDADLDVSPLANETVKVLFYSTGSSPVPVPGVPTTLKTNGEGDAMLTFTPSSTIFNVPGPNHVEFEVTDAVNSSLTVYANYSWELRNPAGAGDYAFYLSNDLYFSGATVTAYWQWDGTNSTVGATVNVTNYVAYDEDTGNIIASGPVGVNAASGSFSFGLPSGYAGDFELQAWAHNVTEEYYWDATAEVDQSLFVAIPSEIVYNPGDTITVAIVAEGSVLTGATIGAFVQASNSGQTLFNGTVTGDSFQFVIPTVAPAAAYDIAAWASTPTAGTIASDHEVIDEASGYHFWAGISTMSSYSDGSFMAGQTVQLSYQVTAFGTSQLPTLMEIEVFPGLCNIVCSIDTPALKAWFVTGSSGSVSFTIPSGTPNGLQTFTVLGGWPAGEGEAQVTINVNSSPSVLNYELGAGSGLTVGWLILLILGVIAVLALVAMGRRRKPTMVMSPSAGTSPSPEWKEPTQGGSPPSGSSSPPTTPPGAQ